jgi:hypothetical protein
VATRLDRESTEANRQTHDRRATAAGHTLRWRLGENATRRGHEYFKVGTCSQCAAEVSVGASWSSCSGVRDARRVPCSGPGTAVLTEIEAGRCADLFAGAVARFGRDVERALG